MPEHRDPDLMEWLRSGDPVADHPGIPDERRRAMRDRVLEAARSPAPTAWERWGGLLPAAAAIALLFALGTLLPVRERFQGAAPEAAYRLADDGTPLFFGEPTSSAGLRPRADLRPRWPLGGEEPGGTGGGRHIEFTTPGGHRVVWNLDTDFRLPDQAGGDDSPSTRS